MCVEEDGKVDPRDLDDPFFCPEVLISEDGYYITVAFGSVLEPWDRRGRQRNRIP